MLLGAAAGVGMLHLWQSFLTTFGYSLSVIFPSLLVVGFVVQCLPHLSKRWTLTFDDSSTPKLQPFSYQWPLTAMLFLAWILATPLLLKMAMLPMSWLSLQQGGHPLFVALISGITTCFFLSVPLAMCGLLPAFLSRRQLWHALSTSHGNKDSQPEQTSENQQNILVELIDKNQNRFLLGAVVGLCMQMLWLAPWLGTWKAFVATIVVVATLLSIQIWFPLPWLTRLPEQQSTSKSGTTPNTTYSSLQLSCLCLMAAGWGALFVLFTKMAFHLFPSFTFLSVSRWPMLLVGVLIGNLFARKHQASQSKGAESSSDKAWERVGLATIAVVALYLICFGPLVDATLWMNTTISNVTLLSLLRIVIVSLPALIIGICWGRLSTSNSFRSYELTMLSLPVRFALPFSLGMVAVYLLQALAPSSDLTVAAITTVATTIFIVSLLPKLLASFSEWKPLLFKFVAPAACLVIGALTWCSYDVALADKILFSGDVFVSYRMGDSKQLLTQIDEGRLVTTVEGEQGTYTLWKYRGNQFLIRKNGLPHGAISENPRICPDFSAEVLPTLFPLTLHQRPDNVLLLGASSSVSLLTCLDSPVQKVVVAEADPGLTHLMKKHIWPELKIDPLADERVQWVELEPALAVASNQQKFDVVVSSPGPTSIDIASPYTTVEHFQNVASTLADDGIFCLRFQQSDYGAGPLQSVVKTLKTVFKQVVAIDMAAGEMSVLATQSPNGFDRPGLSRRVKSPQSQQLLSQLGWDWTIPLNLGLYENETLSDFASNSKVQVNRASNNWLANRLPREVMRWTSGNKTKRQELAAALNSQPSRILNWQHVDASSKSLLRRLSEVTAQQKTIVQNTDQKWSYRKALREQLTTQREAGIRQVSGEKPKLHPQDLRRKKYLKALGELAKKQNPTAAEIEQISEFETPHDPLLSYFLHDEVARLYERTTPRNVAKELDHRLHIAYFTHSQDQSVRNIVESIALLTDHPDEFPDATRRYDNINALLQLLRTRWNLRANMKQKDDRVVLNDIEKSVTAIEKAFDTMDELSTQVDLPAGAWEARKKVMEKSLLRPLRTYRSRIMPHHLKREKERREKMEFSNEEPAES